VFLIANGATLQATDRDLERVAASVASAELPVEALAVWIRQRLRQGR
jgi:prophage maintenance system killer protein